MSCAKNAKNAKALLRASAPKHFPVQGPTLFAMSSRLQKVMTQPINLIFRFLQNVRSVSGVPVARVLPWQPPIPSSNEFGLGVPSSPPAAVQGLDLAL